MESRTDSGNTLQDPHAEARLRFRVIQGGAASAPDRPAECDLDAEDVAAYRRAGDEAAFGRLYARHARRVLALCRRFVPADHAEDVSQEAWARVAKFIRNESAPIRNFAGALHRIVVREGLRYATTERASVMRGGEAEGESALQGLKATGPNPEEVALSNAAVRRVFAVLEGGGVTPRQAEAFRRRIICEEDLPDVAERLGLSANATVVLCRRAGVAIARKLEAGR